MPARWVIHVVGPNYTAGERDRSLLTSCYSRALAVADELGAASVAFPLVSRRDLRVAQVDDAVAAAVDDAAARPRPGGGGPAGRLRPGDVRRDGGGARWRWLGRPVFVLHDHRKPAPHFDLRLEEDGVLSSWAVPRGCRPTPGTTGWRWPVGDHDLDHATYTDATKSIADTGWWELEDRNDQRFVFVLHGRAGARRYALITPTPTLRLARSTW